MDSKYKVGDLVIAPRSRSSAVCERGSGIYDQKAQVIEVSSNGGGYKIKLLESNNPYYYIMQEDRLIPFVEGWEKAEERDSELSKLVADYSMRVSQTKAELEGLERTLDTLVAAQQELRGALECPWK